MGKSFGERSSLSLFVSSSESELGSSDSFQLSTDVLVHPDLREPASSATRPSRDTLSSEPVSEEEDVREMSPRDVSMESQETWESANSRPPDLTKTLLRTVLDARPLTSVYSTLTG